jgi:hypothetical protein
MNRLNHVIKLTISSLVLLVMVILPLSTASAYSSVATFPGTGADVATVGTVAWSNPDRIVSNNNSNASVTLNNANPDLVSHYLRGTNFNFDLPNDATVTAIVVKIGRYSTTGGGAEIRDSIVRLVKDVGGVPTLVGTSNADTSTDWPGIAGGAETEATYNGTNPLWGTSWTVAEIESTNFGVVLAVTNPNNTNSRTGYVDYMTITVSYTTPPTLTVTNSPVTYNGLSQSATVSASVAGSAVTDIKYNGGSAAPTNAGTYAVTGDFTPTDTTNYSTLNDASAGNFIINKATPTLSVTNSPVTYNGSPQAATVSASVAGSAVTDIKYNGSLTAPTNAGTYAITGDFTPTDTTNYNTLNDAAAGNFIINKATPTLSVTNSPVTYNGSPQAAIVSASVPGSAVTDIKYDGSSTAPTNQGTYAITGDFTPTDTTNYNTLNDAVAGSFVISKRPITITADNKNKTYGDADPGFTYQITSGSLAVGDSFSGGLSRAAGEDVGDHAILQNDLALSGNYNLSYIGANLTITQRPITITAADQSKTYGDTYTFAGTEFTAPGLVSGDSVDSVTLTSDGAPATATVFGSPYAIVPNAAVGTGLSNYDITYADGELTVDLKTLTITAADQSKTYGDAFTFLGTEFTPVGLVNSDAVTSVTFTSAGTPATATVSGSPYTILASDALGTGLDNYDIDYVDGELTVDLKSLTITADDQSKIYGDAFSFAGTEFTPDGLIFSDSVSSVTLTSGGAPATATVAGSPYAIVASDALGTGLDNYDIDYVDGSFTVALKPLTITADDQSKIYGDAFSFAGTEFTPVGLVNSDAITNVTLSSDGSPATATVAGSPFAILASDALGSGLENYDIDYVDGELTVGLKSLTITADDQAKTYGDAFTFLGTEFTPDGLIFSDSVSSVTLTSGGTPATAAVAGSPYSIFASAAVGSGLENYDIDYVDGELTVDLKTLTITAADQSKTYADAFSFAGTEFTPDGLLFSDSVSSVTLTSAGTPAAAAVAGSPYAIVASDAVGAGLDNYDIDYVDGSLTVGLRELTIFPDDLHKTYGNTFTFLGTEFTAPGLFTTNGDTITHVDLSSDGTIAVANVGSHDILSDNAAGTGLDNYTIVYGIGHLFVDPKDLTITAADQSKTYGDVFSFAGTEFTPVGLVNSDAVTSVTLSSDGSPATATVAGSPYAILASDALGSGLENYEIDYVDGELTVDLKSLTITADDQSKTYGDVFSFAGTEFTPDGLLFSDSVSSVTLTSGGAPATATVAGSPYAIVASDAVGTGLENYDIDYVDGELTVDLKTLTITAVDQAKTYGDAFLFAGTEFTAPGLVTGNGDSISSVTLTSDGTSAAATVAGSPYAILASAAIGTGLDNYDIDYVDGSLTVDKRLITVTADGKTKAFQQADPELTYIVTGTAAGDDILTVILTRVAGEAIGSYDIQGELLLSANSENYDLVYVGNILTITGHYAYLPLIIRP